MSLLALDGRRLRARRPAAVRGAEPDARRRARRRWSPGPNGAGKSSLIRLAAGLLRPAAGTVERAGGGARRRASRARRAAAARPTRSPSGPARRPAGPGMEAMGLAHARRVPVRMLSTGQRKRAALARVIASGAPLWLLDEPANGLDADGLERLAAAMAAHRAAGGAILAASPPAARPRRRASRWRSDDRA